MAADDQHNDESDAYAALSARAEGSNVNPKTLLATDYFNHFNEVIMLAGLVPDMPEIVEEIREWQPVTYTQHFEASSIADKDLAIEAYDHVPEKYKTPFETTIRQINEQVEDTLEALDAGIEQNDPDMLREIAEHRAQALQRLVDVASAIVHGSENIMSQDEIDALIDG